MSLIIKVTCPYPLWVWGCWGHGRGGQSYPKMARTDLARLGDSRKKREEDSISSGCCLTRPALPGNPIYQNNVLSPHECKTYSSLPENPTQVLNSADKSLKRPGLWPGQGRGAEATIKGGATLGPLPLKDTFFSLHSGIWMCKQEDWGQADHSLWEITDQRKQVLCSLQRIN